MWDRVWLAIAVCGCAPGDFAQAEACEPWVAKVLSVQGAVEVERGGAAPDGSAAAGRAQWRSVEGDETLCPGDHIRVGPLGRAAVQLADEAETVLRLDERTILSFPARDPEAPLWLKLLQGVMHLITRMPQRLQIQTPFVNAAVEGTEFALRVGEAETELIVFEGRVRFENAAGGLVVASQEAALARAGEAPVRRVLVKPRETVEWALYYPPLIDLQLIERQPERYAAALRDAASAYRRNDLAGAFTALDRVPRGERGWAYFLLRAGLLMSVGRVREAEVALAEAERADPRSGGASALRSVIALVRDRKDEALRLAQVGVMLDPRSPLPESALSYAYQGRFEIERALEHARRAVDLSPEDALLWARVSELELSRGDLDAALEAAKKAEALNPTLARTQTVLGFAYLTRIEVDRAKSAFERAIQGDPADPLPRLGMGLAKIRDGDLEGGAREIETAASLDPNDSLIRSYLGKAYFEEQRGGLAETEFEQAKLLDPEDPTPWFYDAIQKQTTNRPVEALHDLDRAIALNDNRAVYRSRLLLDQDLAARSAAIGRIYSDLGFEQRALVEGWKSVNTDPSDYSGHRLLADSYGTVPRHEIARVSELLQSQLLQPINVTPVQPILAESDILILEQSGPQSASFNEFNPLFLRDGLALQASGVVGDNDTYGDEVVHSGVWKNVSYSLGQLHYETKGFRPNNDVTEDLYTAFVQARLSESLSLQLEARHRESERGDLGFDFDLTDFDPTGRLDVDIETMRAGGRYDVTPDLRLIGSAIYVHEFQNNHDPEATSKTTNEGVLTEAQGIFRKSHLSVITGAGYYDAAREEDQIDMDQSHGNGYLYSYIRFPSAVRWTVGASFDSLHEDRLGTIEQVNPKFGVQWDVTPGITLRGAIFRTLKRSLLTDQTIEPTQVAGFNQFFDDFNGTESLRYGIALDHRFGSGLFTGVEVSERELWIPTGPDGSFPLEEDLYRAYLHWAPHDSIAITVQYEMELFEANDLFNTRTQMVPMAFRYFHPSGVTGQIAANFVDQGVRGRGGDEFLLVDAGIGYRLPKRYGIMRLGIRNIFDTDFKYQDIDNRTATVGDIPPFLPERTVLFQFTVAF